MDNSGDLIGAVADWNAFPRRRGINSFAISRSRDSACDQPGNRKKSSLDSRCLAIAPKDGCKNSARERSRFTNLKQISTMQALEMVYRLGSA